MRRERYEPIAEGTIFDSVMILDKRDEGQRRQVGTGFTAWTTAIRHHVTLIREALCQSAAEAAGASPTQSAQYPAVSPVNAV